MEMTRTAVGALAGLCIAAGAGGAYLVSRTGAPVAANTPDATVSAPPAIVENTTEIATLPPAEPVRAQTTRPMPRAATRLRSSEIAERPLAPENGSLASASTPAPEPAPFANAPIETRSNEAPAAAVAEPPAPRFEELVVSADSVLGLQIETSVTTETARLEDEVVARVVRDIRVADRVAIPAGSRAYGEVAFVGRGGRLRDRARLGVTFTSVVLGDGTRVPIRTETVYREGDSPARESTAKIGGGAIGGAIIGGILGGAKGAAIGGSVGAGAGTAAVMAGGRNAATLPAGSSVTVRLLEPAAVTVERE